MENSAFYLSHKMPQEHQSRRYVMNFHPEHPWPKSQRLLLKVSLHWYIVLKQNCSLNYYYYYYYYYYLFIYLFICYVNVSLCFAIFKELLKAVIVQR